jgi:hypothetical protein
MADKTCRKELNRQLQVIQGRLKTLEDNVAGLNDGMITNIGQTCAAFAALVAEGMVNGLPTYIANQLILKLAAAALGQTTSYLQGLSSGAAGALSAAEGAIENALEQILKILTTPIFDWQKLMFKFMLPQLNIPPFGAEFLDAAFSAAENAVAAAQAALAADPLNTQLQAALSAAIDLRDSMNLAAESMNNLTACKIATSVLGL